MSEMRAKSQYAPDLVSPPGETLLEVLAARGMSQAELAERTGRPKKTINEIVQGKAALTPETALQLELVLGIPAGFWNVRESQYRECLARHEGRRILSEKLDWLGRIPYRALIKLGWIKLQGTKVAQLEEVLRFFGLASVERLHEMWETQAGAFRRSLTLASDMAALAAWLRKGEIEASRVEAREFNPDGFRDALQKIRGITRNLPHDFAHQVTNICAKHGVIVLFVPEVPGARVWGATRWLSPDRALIQLSLRYKTDDHLWFTFFHEAGHILNHGRRDVFIEEEGPAEDEKEKEADQFASDFLIPETAYQAFVRRGSFTATGIRRFAYEQGIAPGIVVGRLQYDGRIRQDRENQLKRRLSWV